MLKIKLARFGKKKQPEYRIVINEARDKRDGKYVENIGHYSPTQTPKILDVKIDRYQYWITKGAQPTETVAALVKRFESGNPFPAKKAQLSKKAKAKAEAAKESQTQEQPVVPAAEAAPSESEPTVSETAETPTED